MFVQNIMYKGNLDKDYLSKIVCLYENLKLKSSMLPPDLDLLVEELKRVHLRSYV